MKSFRDIRVIPVVLVAVFGLAVLKIAGLVLDGGYVFDYDPNSTQKSWAQETINFPGGPKANSRNDLKGDSDITGSVHEKPKEEAPKPAAPAAEAPKPDGVVVYPEQAQGVSPSERAILERLQPRRQELETRAREINIRENPLQSTHNRIHSHISSIND